MKSPGVTLGTKKIRTGPLSVIEGEIAIIRCTVVAKIIGPPRPDDLVDLVCGHRHFSLEVCMRVL
jgi:hypothetical protein